MVTQKKTYIDGIIRPKISRQFFGWENSKEVFLSPRDLRPQKSRIRIANFYSLPRIPSVKRRSGSMDGITIRREKPIILNTYTDYSNNQQIDMYGTIHDRYIDFMNFFRDVLRGSLPRVSLVHAWNFSIVASIIFGMFLMTMVYRYLGKSASAGMVEIDMRPSEKRIVQEVNSSIQPNTNNAGQDAPNKDELLKDKNVQKNDLMEKELKDMLKGYPIEKMIPYIKEKDKKVSAFLVGIAKKESNWGKYSPSLSGKDCYNYWGYKSIKGEDSSGDYACFDNPKEAVDIVGKRMETFIDKKNLSDPGKMVTAWKCGYDCSWDDPGSVRKWVSDVKMYYDEVMGVE